jgi:hypothetical protein
MAALTEIEPIEKRKEFSRGLIERIAPQSVLQWCFADDGESVFREAASSVSLHCVETAWLNVSPGAVTA